MERTNPGNVGYKFPIIFAEALNLKVLSHELFLRTGRAREDDIGTDEARRIAVRVEHSVHLLVSSDFL